MNRSGLYVIVAVVAAMFAAVVVIVGIAFAVRMAWHSPPRHAIQPAVAPEIYDEQAALNAAETIRPEMIGYEETSGFAVPFREPQALVVDDDDRIYVAGDQAVAVFSPDGKKISQIALHDQPHCLAVGGSQHDKPGEIYVGMEEHVEVFDPKGTHVGTWPSQGEKAFFTGITATDLGVWVADAGNRVVWRYESSGQALKPIGRTGDPECESEFVVTNHYFDLSAGHNDLVYVVNPRLLRVEGYTQRGELETFWGQGSPAVADFFGCCNPARLAVLPDGRFVTAEKGIPRVKIYSGRGEFETVVVGPPELTDTPGGVAGDHRGRILVLDARAAKVRIFQKKADGKEKQP